MASLEPSKVFAGHDTEASRAACLSWVRDVAEILGYDPPQGIGDSYASFEHLPQEILTRLAPLLQERPSTGRIIEVAGPTWFEVLVGAGVLSGSGTRAARGTRILARDGCVCLSLGEKLIDDMLSSEGIVHERERPYPGSSVRSDWKCGDVYIEYFGLTGDAAYDERTAAKLRLVEDLRIALVSIYPAELESPIALRARLRAELAATPRTTPVVAAWTPPAFRYLDQAARLAERRARQRKRLDDLAALGAARNERLGVIEFLDPEALPLRIPHRLSGPALIWDNGTEEWQQHGRPHRDDGGPAMSRRAPERYEWFRNGVPFRDGDKPIQMERRRDGGWKVVFFDRDDGGYRRRTFAADEPLPDGWLDFPPYAPLRRPNAAAERPPDRRFSGAGTPARVAHVRALVERGALTAAEAASMISDNTVSDDAWARVRDL